MTIGQRISSKRKELGLSQEALGEALSVSRQSIYKWESDASLPDIDKLITLSRLFGVSVGWLLGVEEAPETPAEEQTAPSPEPFSEEQLRLLEEIVSRYQPPAPKKRRRWPVVVLGVLLCGTVLFFSSWMEDMNDQYNALYQAVREVQYSTRSELNGLTGQVEDILKAQNELTADYGVELTASDLGRKTVTFSAQVVPKTYVEGMVVTFLVDTGDGPAEYPAELGPGKKFTGELTCELTDQITISAVFTSGDTSQTQILDQYYGLYSDTLPDISLNDTAWHNTGTYQENGLYQIYEQYVWERSGFTTGPYSTKLGSREVTKFEVGLFLNKKLIHWLEPCAKPSTFAGDWGNTIFFHSPRVDDLKVEDGDILFFAARITMENGDQYMYPCFPVYEMRHGEFLTMDTAVSDYTTITDYTF